MTKQRRRITMIIGAAIAAFGLGGGIAYASGGSGAPQGSSVHVVSSVPSDKSAATTQQQQGSRPLAASDSSETPEKAGESATEEPGESTSESATEQSPPSDGPGGHADPAGNVDHQFNGEE